MILTFSSWIYFQFFLYIYIYIYIRIYTLPNGGVDHSGGGIYDCFLYNAKPFE